MAPKVKRRIDLFQLCVPFPHGPEAEGRIGTPPCWPTYKEQGSRALTDPVPTAGQSLVRTQITPWPGLVTRWPILPEALWQTHDGNCLRHPHLQVLDGKELIALAKVNFATTKTIAIGSGKRAPQTWAWGPVLIGDSCPTRGLNSWTILHAAFYSAAAAKCNFDALAQEYRHAVGKHPTRWLVLQTASAGDGISKSENHRDLPATTAARASTEGASPSPLTGTPVSPTLPLRRSRCFAVAMPLEL